MSNTNLHPLRQYREGEGREEEEECCWEDQAKQGGGEDLPLTYNRNFWTVGTSASEIYRKSGDLFI
jgi:hypothetical protein